VICPGARENPPAWWIEDENGDVEAYVIRNPLGPSASQWVMLPTDNAAGIHMLSYHKKRPTRARRLSCPIQNDDAYQAAATAVVRSAVNFGYYPDTNSSMFGEDDDEWE
jgi:hypothetical protein